MARSHIPADGELPSSAEEASRAEGLRSLAVVIVVIATGLIGALLWLLVDLHHGDSRNAQSTREDRIVQPIDHELEIADDVPSNASLARTIESSARHVTPAANAPKWLSITEPSHRVLPDVPRVELISLLKPRAEAGDAEAAYELALALIDCVEAYNLSPESGLPAGTPNLAQFDATSRETVTHRLDLCEGIDARMLATHVAWLRRAADAGQIDAMLLYGTIAAQSMSPSDMLRDPQAVIDLRARTMAYLDRAVARGSHAALREAANRHDVGIMTARDRVKALAYQLALIHLEPFNDVAKVTGDRYAENLSDDELRRAGEMSRQILGQCCR